MRCEMHAGPVPARILSRGYVRGYARKCSNIEEDQMVRRHLVFSEIFILGGGAGWLAGRGRQVLGERQ